MATYIVSAIRDFAVPFFTELSISLISLVDIFDCINSYLFLISWNFFNSKWGTYSFIYFHAIHLLDQQQKRHSHLITVYQNFKKMDFENVS